MVHNCHIGMYTKVTLYCIRCHIQMMHCLLQEFGGFYTCLLESDSSQSLSDVFNQETVRAFFY